MPIVPRSVYHNACVILPQVHPWLHWHPVPGIDGTWRFWGWLPVITRSGVLVYRRCAQAIFAADGRFLGA
jgi:hypothetical protein